MVHRIVRLVLLASAWLGVAPQATAQDSGAPNVPNEEATLISAFLNSPALTAALDAAAARTAAASVAIVDLTNPEVAYRHEDARGEAGARTDAVVGTVTVDLGFVAAGERRAARQRGEAGALWTRNELSGAVCGLRRDLGELAFSDRESAVRRTAQRRLEVLGSSLLQLAEAGEASGYDRDREGWPHIFTAARGYSNVTKWLEQVNVPEQIADAMRRGYSRLKNGRLGPVIIEVPGDVAIAEAGDLNYTPPTAARSAADPVDVERAARALLGAERPVIHAGQGIMYAEATDELVELAELLTAPVYTTLLGKSAFPESHPLSLGMAAGSASWPAIHFMRASDLIFGAGASMAKHQMSANLPSGKTLVQVTNDESDLNRNYAIDFPMLGDAKLVLRQLIEAVNDLGGAPKRTNTDVAGEIVAVRDEWMAHWLPKLTSKDAPINPYRLVWELQKAIPAADAIVTHDSGSPRDQMVPFYRSAGPRSYIGWGKSHALGTGLGFAMGAKLAAPDKVCINWMGDAAFGMTGLDFETAVRCQIPIITIED